MVIDPLLPSSIAVSFIGPTVQVEEYRDKYEQEVSKWDHDLDIHKNLLKICGKDNVFISFSMCTYLTYFIRFQNVYECRQSLIKTFILRFRIYSSHNRKLIIINVCFGCKWSSNCILR